MPILLPANFSSKPKMRPLNIIVEDVTYILFSQNLVTRKFFFHSLTLKFMKNNAIAKKHTTIELADASERSINNTEDIAFYEIKL